MVKLVTEAGAGAGIELTLGTTGREATPSSEVIEEKDEGNRGFERPVGTRVGDWPLPTNIFWSSLASPVPCSDSSKSLLRLEAGKRGDNGGLSIISVSVLRVMISPTRTG